MRRFHTIFFAFVLVGGFALPLSSTAAQEDFFSELLGNIFKSDSSDYQIKLLASFNAFPLEPFSPLGKGVIGNIRGGLWGNAEITGPIVNPDFTGTLTLNQAGISVPYLGVNYNFSPNAKIGLYNQVFDFKDITLIDDTHNTQAKLSGTIDHR